MDGTADKNKLHGVPCSQIDNIISLKKAMNDFKDDFNKLHITIDGNGKPGMKTDLALLVKDVSYIKTKLSSNSEVEAELEFQRRLNAEKEMTVKPIYEKVKNIKK